METKPIKQTLSASTRYLICPRCDQAAVAIDGEHCKACAAAIVSELLAVRRAPSSNKGETK